MWFWETLRFCGEFTGFLFCFLGLVGSILYFFEKLIDWTKTRIGVHGALIEYIWYRKAFKVWLAEREKRKTEGPASFYIKSGTGERRSGGKPAEVK